MSGGTILPFRRPAPQEVASPVPDLKLSDKALLMACVVGEQAALGTLYDRHHRPVYRFVSRIASAPYSDVEDLVQCTFIEVWKSCSRFHGKGTIRSWIFGISANLTRHYVRSEMRRRCAMDGLSEIPQASETLPDASVNHQQLLGQLSEALQELSYNQRVAFVLCDIEEMSGIEAARTLGIRNGTLWRRLHDARKNLRSKLESGGPS